MRIDEFYYKTKQAVEEALPNIQFWPYKKFLTALINLMEDPTQDVSLKMTCMTVLFEGFYNSLENNQPLKKRLSEIRLERWKNHYSTPTVTFLITHHYAIEKTKFFFNQLSPFLPNDALKPWELQNTAQLSLDQQNSVLVGKESTHTVTMPSEDEKLGQFLKTHNPHGGFTTIPCDPVSQSFIEYASEIAIKAGTILEIGAAFGAASLKAIAKGAKVFCNDIDPKNLAVVKNRYLKFFNSQNNSINGDESKLVLIPGSFPDEMAGLPNNFFDAILICRVLHFFTGEQIEKSLDQLSMYLKPGGKLFVVCETPFLRNWQKFIPEFEKRVSQNVEWPGEIANPAEYEESGRSASLPKFVHWITKEVLERSLKKSSFKIEHLSYIDRYGQFPDDLLFDGRESVGAIAVKP